MQKIEIDGIEYEYTVRLSKRAKKQSLVVHWDGRLEVVVPQSRWIAFPDVRKLFVNHADWIVKNVERQKKNADKTPLQHRGTPRQTVERNTKELVKERIEHYCSIYSFVIEKVVFRPYKSQWGSCSSKSRIGLHYKLSLLPEHLSDYVIVHELCHTIHFNHSKSFWSLVGELCPEFKAHRKALKQYLL